LIDAIERGPVKPASTWGRFCSTTTVAVVALVPDGSFGSAPALLHADRAALLSSPPVQVVTAVSGLKVW
jgi:hypothetical protein